MAIKFAELIHSPPRSDCVALKAQVSFPPPSPDVAAVAIVSATITATVQLPNDYSSFGTNTTLTVND